jgi:hypothetical protein
MVIDVNQVTFVQPLEHGAPDSIAFEQDHGIVWRDILCLEGARGKWQVLINARHAIVHNDFRVLSHRAQNLATGQCGADAVSIRPGVRGNHKPLPRSNFLQNPL